MKNLNLINVFPTTVSTVPLQPIVSNNNRIVANESAIKDDVKPLEEISSFQNTSHMNMDRNNETKSCSTCGKVFPTSIKLSRHAKTHSLLFTHRCKICYKGFTHGGNFKVHMRMHNDERVCQRNYFSNRNSLGINDSVQLLYNYIYRYNIHNIQYQPQQAQALLFLISCRNRLVHRVILTLWSLMP